MFRNHEGEGEFVTEQENITLSKDLMAQIKLIQIRAKHLVNSSFAGEYQSTFKGRGIEFDEVRPYLPGDDIRSIDWNVTARANEPYIKIFRDERELTVMFVVDVSASSQFGTVNKFKNEVAAEITALLAYTALRSNDKVGLVIFSDHVEHYIPPDKGRGHVWRLIRDILSYKSKAKNTDLTVPLKFLDKVQKGRAVVFLISDFLDKGHEQQIKSTAKRHDLIAISVSDPLEVSLPNVGYIEFEDCETGEVVLVNTSNKKFTNKFFKRNMDHRQREKTFFHSIGAGYIPVSTGEPYVAPIVKFFRKREKNGR